jgi:hypothetical protein
MDRDAAGTAACEMRARGLVPPTKWWAFEKLGSGLFGGKERPGWGRQTSLAAMETY